MASFDIAVIPLLIDEGNGKVSEDPNDPGGLTKWGISQRSYPHLGIRNLTRDEAISIYRKDFWEKEYNLINSQIIANKLLSFHVLMGERAAEKCLQRAVRAASGINLTQDGELGPTSIAAINSCAQDVLLAAYKSELAGYIRTINNQKYQNGWLNRAYA